MSARACRAKRNRLASRRRLNVARPTEGRIVVPTPDAGSPLVRVLLAPAGEREPLLELSGK